MPNTYSTQVSCNAQLNDNYTKFSREFLAATANTPILQKHLHTVFAQCPKQKNQQHRISS